MKSTREFVARQLVLIGGGHSHVEVLRRIAMNRPHDIRVTMIGREIETPYTGMLPGFVAGHYAEHECHIDLHRLAVATGARFFADEAVGLDMARRMVLFRKRPPLSYDLVSLDIGSTPNSSGIPGVIEHSLPVKPVDRFIKEWKSLEGRIRASPGEFRLIVVGGGAGGAELSMALQYRVGRVPAAESDHAARLRIAIVSDAEEIAPTHSVAVRRALTRALRERGIELHLGNAVARVESHRLTLANGSSLECDAMIWAVSAAPAAWLADTELARDSRGFVRVDECLRSVSHPEVFATGDVAAVGDLNLEKSGVYAVRQGPILAHNLVAALRGEKLRRYRVQRATLALVSTGEKSAIASRNGLAADGRWVWRVKDWIDRRWMRRYQAIEPGMRGVALRVPNASTEMRCGGCGAKVRSDLLRRALAGLEIPRKTDIVIGLDAPDDSAVLIPPPGMQLVQSVDFFRPFIDDPYKFARVAANHCLSDLYAMGADPHSALAIVTLPNDSDSVVESDLRQLMAGAAEALAEAGAILIGGHTGEGAELGFGLSVNGFVSPKSLLRKAGLRPGDALVLTKSLGTGALFAGHMNGIARGAWIEAALIAMERPNRAAAKILRDHGAVACTDVTGFGLLGHLLEMLEASHAAAEVRPRCLPALDGALDLIARGYISTMAPKNRTFAAMIDNRSCATEAQLELLYDPQTAGGLLAGIPPERAEACIRALVLAGDTAARIIGAVTEAGRGYRVRFAN